MSTWYLAYRNADGVEQMLAVDGDTATIEWTDDTTAPDWIYDGLVGDAAGVIAAGDDSSGARRAYRFDPVAPWSTVLTGVTTNVRDVTSDHAGGAYFIHEAASAQIGIQRVDAAGNASAWLTIDHTTLSPAVSDGEATSCETSLDGTVLYLTHVSDSPYATTLLAVDTTSKSVLWQSQLAASSDSFDYARVRRVPGSDALIVAWSAFDAGVYVFRAARFDFPSGTSSAPTATWTRTFSDSDNGILKGLAVNSTHALFAHYGWTTKQNLLALSLADGATSWAADMSGLGAYVELVPDVIAADASHVVLAVWWANTLFPVENGGFVRLNAATGAMASGGVFPLEAFYARGVTNFEADEPTPGVAALDPRDRLRSSLSEDLGSLLDAVEVIPVDAGFEIAFTNAVTLEPAVRSNFRELFRATDSAEVDFLFYPRPRQNTVMEDQFDGLTLLSRLDRWFPPRTYGATATFGLGATATAQAVVAYVLAQWATLQPWLTYKPVPDLRMPTRGLLPSEYTAGDGLVQTATITIEQDPERPASALDVLHDLLSPFPGAIVRQDSDGDLVIVPRYGPDADEAPIVTLRAIDLYSVSTGKPDPFATINRATFASSGGLTSTNDVPVMQPAWFQLGPNHRLGNAAGWFDPPVDRTNLQPPRGGSDTLQEDLTFGQFGSQKPILWEASPSVIPAGGGIRLEDSSHDPMITSAYRIFGPAGGLAGSGVGTVTILTATIPFTGAWVDAFKWTADIYFVTMRARWVEASRSVEWAIGGNALDGNCWQGCWTCIVEFTLNDSSVAYARGANVTATFGAVGDSLPSATGNAVAESQAALGVIERTVNVSGYELDAATLAAAAEGFVRANITPRMTREIELTVAAQDVTFDRVGRLIELPSGEVGVLVGLTYRDDFTTPPGAWAKTARVQLLDGAAPGAVDDQLDFLTLTNGSILATTAGDPLVLTEV